MNALITFKLAIKQLGISGTFRLLAEKRAKRKRLQALLTSDSRFAELVSPRDIPLEISEKEHKTVIERADEMMHDENYVFTFIHHLKGMPNPWNYDPIEKKYWQKKRYEETRVHSANTPRDVKIVWEINRFKYLPLLAQAAYMTKEKKYADECEARILSWIDDNPFAASINWSSPLEIAIRTISWTASLRILALAGFDISKNEKIARSIWQHAAYLNAELSTDKIVRSNHLIGETAGLYILSSFFSFPEAIFYQLRAKKILTDSILKQTYPEGASREASGWYHTFVTDFADLALRTARTTDDSFGKEFTERFNEMMIYRNSIILPDDDPVRFGDCDFGKAINLSLKWKDAIFGANIFSTKGNKCYFEEAQHLTGRLEKNYLFARAGEFGWGGDGFSSHAHDDFLSPILALDGVNILVDPGTYAYNGAPEDRDKERNAHYHNGLIIGGVTGAVPKPSFGWVKTRPDASIDFFSWNEDKIIAEASYGEWRGQHSRYFTLSKEEFILEDRFKFKSDETLEWNFHFHPRWRMEKISLMKFALRDFRNNHYEIELSGIEAEFEFLNYDFAPAYMQKSKAWKLRIHNSIRAREERIVSFILRKAST
jgi:hypothetical protein